ncbi:MAG: nucleotide-binding protein [Chloroflexota bacterium]
MLPREGNVMKIAISGKGGSGKTTLAATLARSLARRGHAVLAVDGDPNPNLGVALGVPPRTLDSLRPLPSSILVQHTGPDGKEETSLALPIDEIASRYGVGAPDGVTLLMTGKVDHAGAG